MGGHGPAIVFGRAAGEGRRRRIHQPRELPIRWLPIHIETQRVLRRFYGVAVGMSCHCICAYRCEIAELAQDHGKSAEEIAEYIYSREHFAGRV